MYKKILVSLALDHGLGVRALNTARAFMDDGGEIIAVHVLEPVSGYAQQFLEPHQQEAVLKQTLDAINERIGDQQDAEAVILTGHPGRSIPEYAEEMGADCIIVGSHKPGMKDFFLGSTAARIVRHSICSVHVLR